MEEISRQKYLKYAVFLGYFTVIYNIIEGVVSIIFGLQDSELSLFGFGADSFVETVSALGVLTMIYRQKKTDNASERSKFESGALKVTSISFFVLTVILIAMSINNIIVGAKPETAFWGVVISMISMSFMLFLIIAKLKIGRALKSDAIIADAKCSQVCVYMSVALLISAAGFQLFHIQYIDAAGAIILAYFSLKEGKEAWENSKNQESECHCHH